MASNTHMLNAKGDIFHITILFKYLYTVYLCSCCCTLWARKTGWLIFSSASYWSWKIMFNLGRHCPNYSQLPQGVFRTAFVCVCLLSLNECAGACNWYNMGVWVSLHNCVHAGMCACTSVCVCVSLLVLVFLKDKTNSCLFFYSSEKKGKLCC